MRLFKIRGAIYKIPIYSTRIKEDERFTGSFTNRQYVNFDADDATWGMKKHDKRNDYSHKHNNMR